jgi:hypothetical protein
MVEDNWLNEEYEQVMLLEDIDLDQQNDEIDQQFAEWEKDDGGVVVAGGGRDGDGGGGRCRIEPWDRWNDEKGASLGNQQQQQGGGGKEEHVGVIVGGDDNDETEDVEQEMVKDDEILQNKSK